MLWITKQICDAVANNQSIYTFHIDTFEIYKTQTAICNADVHFSEQMALALYIKILEQFGLASTRKGRLRENIWKVSDDRNWLSEEDDKWSLLNKVINLYL